MRPSYSSADFSNAGDNRERIFCSSGGAHEAQRLPGARVQEPLSPAVQPLPVRVHRGPRAAVPQERPTHRHHARGNPLPSFPAGELIAFFLRFAFVVVDGLVGVRFLSSRLCSWLLPARAGWSGVGTQGWETTSFVSREQFSTKKPSETPTGSRI